MKYKKYVICTFFIAYLLTTLLPAASGTGTKEEEPSQLSLERIFNSPDFQLKRFGPARWLEHQKGYTILETPRSETGDQKDIKGSDIVRYDPKTGRREILVPSSKLVPPGKDKPLEIADYRWSPTGNRLLVFTNTQRVWRENTRGDYWILNMETGKLWQLGGDAEPSGLMFAKFSPCGSRVAFVYKNNLYVQELDEPGHPVKQLTHDGSQTIINGTFDWVYEEEFFLRDGFRWSPDGKHIAYWQLDAQGVGEFYLINNTDGLYSKIIPVQYPKAGTTNSAARVGVVSSSGGKTLWFDLPGDPRRHYIARMDWADSSDEIVFQRLNRLQNTNWVILGNIHTGDTRTILEEKDSAWVDVGNDLFWLDRGRRFTWVSERDGWRHLYLVSRSGKEMTLVTRGDFDVISVEKVDKKGGWVYYIASPYNRGQRYLYRIPLKGKAKPQRLTPLDLPGTHAYQLSGDAQWAFHTYSTLETPPVFDLVRLPRHHPVRVLEDNRELQKKVSLLRKYPVEFFTVEIGEDNAPLALDALCIKPPDFNETKKYPVLFYVYGEPWNQTVLDRWGRDLYLWHLMLAQQGYVVITVDNRGTPAPRGREWRKCIYRQVGILASADQAAAVRAIIKTRPYVDEKRIGIWGWSGGGSMTLNALFRYPRIYRMGMSVAPVADMRYYDTIYQERYMGLPEDNKEGYKNGSPITFAHQLEGKLLLVHGTGDDNVHYQNSEALINALVEANKPFTMMAYPNRSHGIFEGKNTSRHLFELLTRFLKENLPVETEQN